MSIFRHHRLSAARRASRLAVALAIAVAVWLAIGQLSAWAQAPKRLFEQEPYDVITLNAANENKVIRVFPLPVRKVPEKPKRTDKVKVKLVEDGTEYEVDWLDIAKVDFFEGLVLAEANRLTGEGKFDEAFDYFAFLLSFYPETPGLADGRQSYLYLAAGAAYRQKKYDEALAILEELLAQNPNYRAGETSPTLLQVLGNIAEPMLTRYLDAQDYRSTRTLLARLIQRYSAADEPFAQRWRQKLIDLASMHKDAAQEHLQDSRFVQAHDEAVAMIQVWPELAGAAELFAQIARQYPLLVVGVEHPARAYDPRSLQDSAARRTGRLVDRLLVEFEGPGPEGGRYTSPLAAISQSDDGLSLSFRLPANLLPGQPGTYDLAQRLIALAQPAAPEFSPAWSRILESVRTEGARDVRADLRLPHVVPEALLQVPYAPRPSGAAAGQAGNGPFALLSQEETLTRFTANTSYPYRRAGQLAEVAERYYSDPQRLLIALKQGEVDLVDRIFPGDIAALTADPTLVVAPYAAPTTHVLAVRGEHPYLANRTFRRGLMYGANREVILNQGLLRGRNIPGCRVVSGPFPASAPSLELQGYGYDETVEPRPYDPRLGMTLVLLAQAEIKGIYEKQKKPVPLLGKLLLGHPGDETSRVACRALVKQWKTIGVECDLVEFPPGTFDDAAGKCDLVYLQVAAWEPIVDAARLLGPGGPAASSSNFVQLTLRQLEQTKNWQQARDRLRQLHRLVHEDVTLLPLFQTIDHYAYRRTLQGLGPKRVTLYQDIDQWQPAPQLAEAKP
jgi:tetratricopeptide (TPR) repeat protein